jgi:hypothetical protein
MFFDVRSNSLKAADNGYHLALFKSRGWPISCSLLRPMPLRRRAVSCIHLNARLMRASID